MKLDTLLSQINKDSNNVEFEIVIETINNHFIYKPTRFSNGIADDMVINNAGTNEGSCKVFAFGRIMELSKEQTLACFGQYYKEVLSTPKGESHANIRTFMRHGWPGIKFDSDALIPES